jgi:FkbM family methyltransferase
VIDLDLLGGPFDSVLDVGGNVGEFAEQARTFWPDAWITSFEPLPELVEAQRVRARGRWQVEEIAISDRHGTATLNACINQPSASSMQPLGPVRRDEFGIKDQRIAIEVRTAPLDDYLEYVNGSLLVKVDVEGYEGHVLNGGRRVLRAAEAVLVEMQQDPSIFLGSAPPWNLDGLLRECGLSFAGLAGAFLSPGGRVLQFDAIYRR